MDFADFAEAFCGVFGGDVALGHAEHFKADHELADCCGAQQGRIEVGVEVPFWVGCAVGGRLVEAHGVREAGLEEVVEADGDAVEGFGECVSLFEGELGEGSGVALAEQQDLERPDGPEGYQGGEVIVFKDDAVVGGLFRNQVFAEQAMAGEGEVFALGPGFGGGLVGNEASGPDLAVGMGVACAHHGAAILEDLDVVEPAERGEGLVFGGPGVDDGANLGGGHAGEG